MNEATTTLTRAETLRLNKLLTRVGFAACIMALLPPLRAAENKPVYRCPAGSAFVYTDELSPEEARNRGCRRLPAAPAEVAQSTPSHPQRTKQEWTELGEADDFTIFYDIGTIRKLGTTTKLWTLTTLTSPRLLNGVNHQSIKSQYEYDCSEERYRLLAMIFYEKRGGLGKVIDTRTETQGWNPVAPRTTAENLFRIACE